MGDLVLPTLLKVSSSHSSLVLQSLVSFSSLPQDFWSLRVCFFLLFFFFFSVWLLYNAMLVSAGQEKLLYVYMYPLPLGSPSPKSFLVIKNKDLMHYYILCWKRKNAFCWGWVCRAPDTGRSPETSLKRRIFKGRQKYKEEPSVSFCDKNCWKISLFPFGQPFPNYSCCKNLWVAPPHTSVYP